MPENPSVVFDGVCNLCNGFVRFLLARERGASLRFAPVQSPAGQELMHRYGIGQPNAASIILIDDEGVWSESTAVLRVVGRLRAPWRFAVVLAAIPSWVRNPVYRLIATHRYRVFGRRDACMVPTGEDNSRFW